jgi:DNA-binding response OmpR family regulator
MESKIMKLTTNLTETGVTTGLSQREVLPASGSDQWRFELSTQHQEDLRGKIILLADDDAGVREMLGRLLESERYEVVLAKTGREAAARFSSNAPDLVLLDLNMPDKDGWEAFGMMCEKDSMVPVIVITARPEQHPQAVELGIDALMEKPLNLPLLLQTIRTLLSESEVERARRLINPNFKTLFLKEAGSGERSGR